MEVKGNPYLYKEVPLEAETNNADLGLQKDAPSKKTFVTDFLKRNVPGNRIKQGLEEDLTFKKFFLNSLDKPKQKVKQRAGSRKSLSCAEKRRLNLFNLKAEEQKYSMYESLHELWKDYLNDLIPFDREGGVNRATVEQQLVRADLHGAVVMVTRSKCPSLVGIKGIVVQETRNVFKVITKEDRLKTIPKYQTIFTIQHAGHIFTLYGSHFGVRPSERVSKKFKSKPTIDL